MWVYPFDLSTGGSVIHMLQKLIKIKSFFFYFPMFTSKLYSLLII